LICRLAEKETQRMKLTIRGLSGGLGESMTTGGENHRREKKGGEWGGGRRGGLKVIRRYLDLAITKRPVEARVDEVTLTGGGEDPARRGVGKQ